MEIFLVGPFFTESEIEFMKKVKKIAERAGHSVTTPLDIGYQKGGSATLFRKDLETISKCKMMIAVLDGFDEGTMCEIGYAKAKQRKIIGIWTDNERILDPFIKWMCDKIVNISELGRLKF